MTNLASSLGFTRKEDIANVVKEVMASIDADGNGEIDYPEFLPMAANIVQVCIACLCTQNLSYTTLYM